MKTLSLLTSGMGLATLLVAGILPGAVFAGEQSRAEAAIAQARGKLEAGDRAGAGHQAPLLQAQAREALTHAKALLADHKKGQAIDAAHHAGDLADQAVDAANLRRSDAGQTRGDAMHPPMSAGQQDRIMSTMHTDAAGQSSAGPQAKAGGATLPTAVPVASPTPGLGR